jgi:NAD-reducing hydrogenase small subunit
LTLSTREAACHDRHPRSRQLQRRPRRRHRVDAQEVPPDIDVAIVEGAVSSEDDLEKVRKLRRNSRILVALGDCAVAGNVPMMRNPLPVKGILDRVYVEGADANKGVPTEIVPPLIKQAAPLHDVVKVDLHVPGCPPPARAILFVLKELLEGRIPISSPASGSAEEPAP